MWRLFLDDISLACESAGIESFPIPYDSSSQSCSSATSLSWSLPPPTQLLYGISPSLIAREPFWPESIHLCGSWKLPEDWSIPEIVDSDLQSFIERFSDRLIYTGFGSMETFVKGVNWTEFLQKLDKGF